MIQPLNFKSIVLRTVKHSCLKISWEVAWFSRFPLRMSAIFFVPVSWFIIHVCRPVCRGSICHNEYSSFKFAVPYVGDQSVTTNIILSFIIVSVSYHLFIYTLNHPHHILVICKNSAFWFFLAEWWLVVNVLMLLNLRIRFIRLFSLLQHGSLAWFSKRTVQRSGMVHIKCYMFTIGSC